MHFFGGRSPSKLVYISVEGAFRKLMGWLAKNYVIKNTQMGPLVSEGVEPLRERPSSKYAPGFTGFF